MPPAAVLAKLAVAPFVCVLVACGSSAPREADIYHDPALRPGVVRAEGAWERLLARLSDLESAEVVQIAHHTFEVDPPYHSASGRWCRAVRGAGTESRLACESGDGWVLVPQVLPTAPEPASEPTTPAEAADDAPPIETDSEETP